MSGINIDFTALFGVLDDLFTSDEERNEAKFKILQLQAAGHLAQIDVNKTEAASSSIFVAGWRPFIGWVCGLAFAWHFLMLPIVTAVLATLMIPFVPPAFEMQALLTVLGGMLGLGAMRTHEKVNGVARESVSDTVDRRASKG